MEASTERQIRVRQVTQHQLTWTEGERGQSGRFTIQLILDNGAEEYVLRPTGEDAEVLMRAFAQAKNVYFDLERKVLMFGNQTTG
jgi:hypothetical protein